MKKYFSMQLHITDTCDQRCEHCYIFGRGEHELAELDMELLIKIVDDYSISCSKLEKKPYLVITGGDPILHKDFWQFIEYVNSKEIPFGILGNPFHLNFEVVKKLEENGCLSYQMSLDGLENTHDYIRKPGSFKETLDALKYFEGTKVKTTIMSTVSKMNIKEIPELVEIVVKNNVSNFTFARYCPSSDDLDMMVSPEEYKEFLTKMWGKYEEYKDCKTRFAMKEHLWKLFLLEKGIFNPEKTNYIVDGCHCGISHITTLADGKVYACRRSETEVGKIEEESFYDIFLGKKMEQYRKFEEFKYCNKCELFSYCRGCPSVTKTVTGDFYEKDPQCWKVI